ncbi:hypothetical protein [Paraburkholderia bryophila]|uniref:Uncharacterized protein n=1 Tax=Paraburkholderia bryophila TaxID=420952 RepID=A0A7Y9W6W5_9BURK|nr:hypothetical protein [Paraburkholderia bryophila]NYH15295.1 hypothetical protein [Paraburkholderia bryophila]
MKFVYRLTHWGCLATALIAGHAAADPACNKTPVPAQSTQAFGRDMIVNGVPTSIVGVQFAGTIDDVSKAFRAYWTREDVAAKGQTSASGVLLSALDSHCLYVLSLPPQPEGPRARGLMSVIRLDGRPAGHRIPDATVPLPDDSRVLSDIESRDPGQTGRTWLFEMPGDARWNAQRYRNTLATRGWQSLGRQPDYQSSSAQSAQGTAFAMQLGRDSVDVSFSDRNGRTFAVVNATRNR